MEISACTFWCHPYILNLMYFVFICYAYMYNVLHFILNQINQSMFLSLLSRGLTLS